MAMSMASFFRCPLLDGQVRPRNAARGTRPVLLTALAVVAAIGGLLAQPRPANAQSIDSPPPPRPSPPSPPPGPSVKVTGKTWLTATELKDRPQDLGGIWLMDLPRKSTPLQMWVKATPPNELTVQYLKDRDDDRLVMDMKDVGNRRWEGRVWVCLDNCPDICHWAPGSLNIGANNLSIGGEWHSKKGKADCSGLDENRPDAGTYTLRRLVGAAFVPIAAGKYMNLVGSPPVGNQARQFKAEVRLVARYDGIPAESVRAVADRGSLSLSDKASGTYDFVAEQSGVYELRFELLGTDGKVFHTDRLRVEIPAIVAPRDGALELLSTGDFIAGRGGPATLLILDASGSMKERHRLIDGKLKIDAAKEVLLEVIRVLPPDARVGLRVYGHRIREKRRGDCQDSELMIPIGTLDKGAFAARILSIRALGTTPIAFSLQRAAQDLAGIQGERLIVLVTDGKEECRGDPASVVAELKRAGIHIRLDVVGLALADEATKAEMRRIAEITGGQYFDANNRAGFQNAIRQAFGRVPFDVQDAAGKTVASGLLGGGPIKLAAGTYTIIVAASGQPVRLGGVAVAGDKTTRIELSKRGDRIESRIDGPR